MKLLKEFTKNIVDEKQWNRYDYTSYRKQLKKYLKEGSSKSFSLRPAITEWYRNNWTREWSGEDGTCGMDMRPDEQLMVKYMFGLDHEKPDYHPQRFGAEKSRQQAKFIKSVQHIDHYFSYLDHYLDKEYSIKSGKQKREKDDEMRFFENMTKADLLVVIQCMKSAYNKNLMLTDHLESENSRLKQQSLIRHRKYKAYQGVLAVILEMPNPVLDKLVAKARGRGLNIIREMAKEQKKLKQ